MADTTNISQESDFGALVKTLKERGEADVIELKDDKGGTIQVLAVTDGYGKRTITPVKKFLDEYRTAPERREGTATLTTIASFCDHVKRFMDDHSVIFADVDDRKDARLVSVLDYHEKKSTGAPRFGKHRGAYKFPLTDEWNAWNAVNGKEMVQGAFAQFLEDRIMDIQAPSEAGDLVKAFAANLGGDMATAQRLTELSNGLNVRVDTAVTNAVNLSTGEGQINFQETHGDKDGGPIKVPKGFAIAIPVFKGGTFYSMPVRLRYRVAQQKVLWTLLLWRSDRVWDDAIKIACDFAHAETGRDLLYGKPETA